MFVLLVKMESYQAQESKMQRRVKTMSEKFTETKHEVQKEVVRALEVCLLTVQIDSVLSG